LASRRAEVLGHALHAHNHDLPDRERDATASVSVAGCDAMKPPLTYGSSWPGL
jgi:hypothetical protein